MTNRRGAWCRFLLAGACFLSACAAETVIYKDVPEWQLREGVVPERLVLADGTVVIHRPRRLGDATDAVSAGDAGGGVADQQAEAGKRQLHAIVPEQVLTFVQQCVLDADWKSFWDEALAEHTRGEYEAGGGFDEFAAFMDKHRNEIYAMLNRMGIGLRGPEVLVEQKPGGVTRIRFHRVIARDFEFAAIDLVYEMDRGLKVLMIHPYPE